MEDRLDLNIGHATAYAYAVSKGYTGTEEQFALELAQFAQNAQKVAEDRAAVEALVDEFLNTTVPSAVQSVTDEGTRQIELVGDVGTTQIGLVQDEGTTQVGNVNNAGTDQVSAVNQAGQTQVEYVTNEGTTQVDRVQDKGDEVIASIPSDYSDLTAEVDDLSRQLNDETTGLDSKAPVILETAFGAIASFSDGAESMPIRKIVATIEPVQAGSGDPSPDNERPISGWTGCNASRTGKNLILSTLTGCTISYNGTITVDNRFNMVVAKVKKGVTYTVTTNETLVSGFYYGMPALGSVSYNNNRTDTANKTITVPIDGYIAFRTAANYETPQVEIGTVATLYEAPYQYKEIYVTFPSSAYGGTLTINPDGTGELLVNRAIFNLGIISYWKKESNIFYATIASNAKYVKDSESVCSCYKTAPANVSWNSLSNREFILWPGLAGGLTVAIAIRDDSCATSDDLKSIVNGQTVTYLLASHQTYQLTAEQVSGILTTLYGQNNIWVDTGDVEVTYPADTKLYIDNKITQAIANALNS